MTDHADSAPRDIAKLCDEIAFLASEIPPAARGWYRRNATPARYGDPFSSVGRTAEPSDPTGRTAQWLAMSADHDVANLKAIRDGLRKTLKRLRLKEKAQPEVRRCECGNLAPDRRHPETREPWCENCYGKHRRAQKKAV